MLVAVLTGFALALGAPLLVWAFKRASGPILAIFPAFLFAYLLQFVPEAAQGRPWRFTLPWDVASGLEVSFRADALSLYFGLLLTLVAAAAFAATAAPEIGEGARARTLVAIAALFSSAFGFVFADQPILVVTFAAGLSLSMFLALTAGGDGEARLRALWILLAWLLADLLLLVLLARLFADVRGGLLGAGGVSSLAPNGRLEPAWLSLIFALKLAPLFLALAHPPATPQAPALAAAAGLALPAMLGVVMRFSAVLPEEGRLGLLALAGAGLLVGAVGGLGARRTLSVFAGLTLAAFSSAAIEIALATDASHAAALLVAATAAFALASVALVVPAAPDHNLKSLRAEVAATPVGASLAVLALGLLAGLVPSTGLLAIISSANAGVANEPALAFPVILASLAIVGAIAARIIAILLFGERGETRALTRSIPAASATPLLLVAIAMGCAPGLVARLMIGPAVRPGYEPSVLLPSPEAWAAIAGAIAVAALLFWQKLLFTRLLKALAKLKPAKAPLSGAFAARLARLAIDRAAAPSLPVAAVAGISALALLGAAAIAWPGAVWMPHPTDAAAFALAVAALIAAAVAIPQRRFAPAVPVVAIAGGLAGATVLALGAVELGFVMLLVLVLQTVVLLITSAREPAPPAARKPARLATPARLAAALVVGVGFALAAVGAGTPAAQTVATPAGITGLVGATGLALREAGLTAIERWSGVVLVLLILGVAVADLSSRPRGDAK